MKVSEFIEWLQTMPQDTTVMLNAHYSGTDYYEQGGTVYVEVFTSEEGNSHYEVYTDSKGDTTLTIGTVGN